MSSPAQGASPPAGLDRRRAERIPVPPRGGAVSVVGGRLINVSLYGMLIESLVPMERDARLRLRIVIAGEKVDVETQVVACSLLSSARRKLFGVGLEFVDMPEEVRKRLAEALVSVTAGA